MASEIYFDPFLHTFGEKEEYAVHAKDVHKIALVTKPLDKWLAKYEASGNFKKDGDVLNYHMAYLILLRESNRPEALHCIELAWELAQWVDDKWESDMRDYLRKIAALEKAQARKRTTHS